jgi:plastocyanin
MKRYAGRLSSTRPLICAWLVVCLSMLLAACGDQAAAPTAISSGNTPGTGTGTGTAVAASGPTTVNIDMTGFKFVPADITIAAGTTVIWTNKDAVKHTVTEDSGVFDSGTMDKGGAFSRKFDTPGSVSYYCKFHGSPGQGMFAHITVTAAPSQSAQASPTAGGSGTTVAVAPTNTTAPAGNPTTMVMSGTTTAAPSQAAAGGTVRFTDSLSQTDQIILSVSKMPAKPETKAFYGWLVNSANGNDVGLGRLTPDANGAVNRTYEDPANGNLLAAYDSVLITNEDLESVPSTPSADVALSGKLPPQALVHIRHLLVSFPATPKKIGLEVGLRSQVELVRQHAQFMSDAQASGDLATVKLHAEHLVNIIEGTKGTDYGDINKDGKVTNPGDGYGLLPNGDQLGYLQGSKDHAALAAAAPDATADIMLHAGHVGITVDNVTGWVTTIRDTAIEVAQSPNVKATDPLVRRILALSGQALNGVDLNGDGQILPIPGSGGAITSYQHAQLMAGIPLTAGSSSSTTAPTAAPATAPPTTAPVPATATVAVAPPTTASGNEIHIPIQNFAFGDPVTVKVGTKVTWTNLDAAQHTVTADDKSFDSGVLAKGQSFSFTFTKAGTVSYYCAIHGGAGGQGMASKITVQL